jgi:hypothetical protein
MKRSIPAPQLQVLTPTRYSRNTNVFIINQCMITTLHKAINTPSSLLQCCFVLQVQQNIRQTWKDYDDGVCCTEFIEFFWTFSIVLYSKKHDVSETWSVSVLRWRWGRRPTQLGPLEREREREWLRLTLSKGPNWVGVFSPTFTWGRKQIKFPKRRVFWSTGRWKMSKKFCEFCTTKYQLISS